MGCAGAATDILATPQRAGKGQGQGPGGQRASEQQTTVEHIPLDWSIKRSVTFRSARPFDWCKLLRSQPNVRTRPCHAALHAMHSMT
jgi:hypothetical protein